MVTWQLEWWLAVLVVVAGGYRARRHPRPAGHADAPAALHRHPVRSADRSRGRALLHQRRHRGLREFGQSFPTLEWLTAGRTFGVPHSFLMFLAVAAIMGVLLHRSVLLFATLFVVGKNEEAARYSVSGTRRIRGGGLHHKRRTGRQISSIYLAMYTRSISPASHGKFLRALRHSRRRAGRAAQAARRRGLDPRHRAGRAILLQIPQNLGEPARHPRAWLNFAVMGGAILIGVLVADLLQLTRLRNRRTKH